MTWRESAACFGENPILWDGILDHEHHSTRKQRQALAIAVCERCTVTAQCAADTIPGRDEGVRAGQVLPDVQCFARNGEVVTHGSPAGYQAHRRRGEKPCRSCMDAHNQRRRDRRQQREVAA